MLKLPTPCSLNTLPKNSKNNQPLYRPINLVKDVQREIGVKISYSKAFRIKERANEINNGTHESAYLALPKYCQDIEITIPTALQSLRRHKKTNFFVFSFVMVPLQPDSIIVALLLALMGPI